MKTLALIPALLLLPLLSGCHKDTIAGKWQGTAPANSGASVALTCAFTEDGKETMDMNMKNGPLSLAVSMAGTYKVDGKTLTQNLTPSSMTMGTRTVPIPAGQAKTTTAPFTLDGDRLTLTDPQSKQSITLTRVKP